MSNIKALMTSKSGVYGTPRPLYEMLNREFHFTIDLAADKFNHKHARYYTKEQNCLAQSWEGETGFLNPEFGLNIGQFAEKTRDSALYESGLFLQILPARVDAQWWLKNIMNTDKRAGRLRKSWYNPDSRVQWLQWEALITGVYFHDERIIFEVPGEPQDSAPFPAAFVFHAHPSRRPAAPRVVEGDLYLTRGWPR